MGLVGKPTTTIPSTPLQAERFQGNANMYSFWI